MPNAEIITIGTEILLGEIVDTNSRYIARVLRDEGIDLFWTSTVGDNVDRISEVIQASLKRSDIVITTGGLGPTIDDPTREAIAKAFNVTNEFQENLWQDVIERFKEYGKVPTENNKRQAYIPAGAMPIPNPVGTAPAFIMETSENVVISLPGVPSEMEVLLMNNVIPYLKEKFTLNEILKTRILRTAGVGESQIDELITDLEKSSNPTLGLSAHAGTVDLRITAKAENEIQADKLIKPMEEELRKRLGDMIFGVDEESLADAAMNNLSKIGWKLAIVESGLNGNLSQALTNTNDSNFVGSKIISKSPSLRELNAICQATMEKYSADACLGVVLSQTEESQELKIIMISPITESDLERSYGGPPQIAPKWAESLCLNYLRMLWLE
ncbi:MAG: CinA family nicotinamide mononucleotide deamidase-related protein [Chloroflexi bacterium]|jgi:nicotinamide-nucleotide amidase|nr:CinA family nicotinamide mononucleotide deamidase-related protein [Chloroflexota bacterium]MBT3670691.1 CinA family nicotinamide mononucleotide deamidase-related protein [Chloroflexota bacterium]MBT4002650.1 CinA family nicotinamide mononucleotide deamidase-related protein [Chloroflexota bacterium]MBT4306273.1 CinA family nicotinamide mononucleotide deamidase-related protein [Chloroflexota bacterium]MBT4532846.1 CinA family nicotinamide mononucleotide deamidase-related protein [Chloroflexota